MNISVVEAAVGVLANTMRLYGESQARFVSLFPVDREEAIDNTDRAFEAKLEAVHTLYDVTKGELSWFDAGDTALLIAIRNAIHHRDHPLFRSFYATLLLDGKVGQHAGAAFLLASHRYKGDALNGMGHYFRLEDVRLRLDPNAASPYREPGPEIRARQKYQLVTNALSLDGIYGEGQRQRFPVDQIYIDLVPIFVSGMCRVFKALKGIGVRFKGFDAGVYAERFISDIEVDLRAIAFETVRLDGSIKGPPCQAAAVADPLPESRQAGSTRRGWPHRAVER